MPDWIAQPNTTAQGTPPVSLHIPLSPIQQHVHFTVVHILYVLSDLCGLFAVLIRHLRRSTLHPLNKPLPSRVTSRISLSMLLYIAIRSVSFPIR